MRRIVIVLVGLAIGGAGPMDQPNDIPLLSRSNLPQGVTYPERIGTLPPTYYPPVAIRCGMTGTATVELLVTADGLSQAVRVNTSTGYTLLDAASLSVAGQYRWSPATRDGVPIPARIDVDQKWEFSGRSRASQKCTLPASAFTNGTPPAGSPDEVAAPR